MGKEKEIEKQKLERTVLVGVETPESKGKLNEYLDELAFLVLTAGGIEVKRFKQNLERSDSKTYVGTGKLEEVRIYIEDNDVDICVFDDELSPSQLRNIERILKCRILDRTNLILDIFAKRAQTSYAKTQVELAQYQYLLPRLTRMWTHLERQQGGIGMRGPGETEIETDRRIIYKKIALLKKRLEKIDKQMITQRKNRGKLVRVALVGYTNVGKSTLMNILSKSEVFAENKLFATLDTTVRKVVVENIPFLVADTVGFIRKLPHGLVESFKSTLDEVREADVLLHIVDISHPEFEEQYNVVNETLSEINSNHKPTITVFNKIDQYTFEEKDPFDLAPLKQENLSLDDLKKIWIGKQNINSIFISAKKKINIDDLKSTLYNNIKEIHIKRFPYNDFLYDISSE